MNLKRQMHRERIRQARARLSGSIREEEPPTSWNRVEERERVIHPSRKSSEALPKEEINKASLRFITDHKRGSLATVLNVMSDCNLNLTKIHSLPVIETPWKYAFFVDVTFQDYQQFAKAKSLLEIMSENFTVLGEYKNALQ